MTNTNQCQQLVGQIIKASFHLRALILSSSPIEFSGSLVGDNEGTTRQTVTASSDAINFGDWLERLKREVPNTKS